MAISGSYLWVTSVVWRVASLLLRKGDVADWEALCSGQELG